MTEFAARVLADSVGPVGVRLTTLEIRAPRVPVWEHVLTHRALSRNASSHRAVPVPKLARRATVLPIRWGAQQKGMVPEGEIQDADQRVAALVWERGRRAALKTALDLADLGAHKQIANRPIRPYETIEAVVSATDWRNFFTLRCAPDVEDETRRIAEMMAEARERSTPARLAAGEWHLPYVTEDDWRAADRLLGVELHRSPLLLAAVSAARCARVSTLHHGEDRGLQGDVDWTQRELIDRRHWSPLEHQAEALATCQRVGNYRGFRQYRKHFPGEDGE